MYYKLAIKQMNVRPEGGVPFYGFTKLDQLLTALQKHVAAIDFTKWAMDGLILNVAGGRNDYTDWDISLEIKRFDDFMPSSYVATLFYDANDNYKNEYDFTLQYEDDVQQTVDAIVKAFAHQLPVWVIPYEAGNNKHNVCDELSNAVKNNNDLRIMISSTDPTYQQHVTAEQHVYTELNDLYNAEHYRIADGYFDDTPGEFAFYR
ncbi:MAG: hypothetical protein H9901_00960 [Candidatus Paralactobacillus gallistercoris]|uniref:Uncharacterized protein n=1 Tax=Candidatus Paralactobacillus gallistercoris TaxID=2838724 RepID=A0A948TIK4_9LACO|nr:hypothetical protein [Candidatus Paralactobacillus gallistercoris]